MSSRRDSSKMSDSSKKMTYEAYRSSTTDLTVNLNSLLKDKYSKPFDLDSFNQYVSERYCSEMIDFIFAIRSLSKENISSLPALKPKIQEIYRLYIDEESPHALNLKSETYKNCQNVINNIDDITITELEAKSGKQVDDKRTIPGLVVEIVFEKVYQETIKLVKENLFHPFCKQAIATQSLRLARFEAFWFLPSVRKTMFCYDGTYKYNKDHQLTLKSFFSYPEPAVESESQTLFILCILEILICITIDILLNVPYIFIIPLSGYVLRFLCGPKLNYLSFFNVVFFSQFMINLFPKFFVYKLMPAQPKKISQAIGTVLGSVVLIFRLLDYYLYDEEEPVSTRPFLITYYSLVGVAIFALFNEMMTGICLGLISHNLLVKLGVFEEECMECSQAMMGIKKKKGLDKRLDDVEVDLMIDISSNRTSLAMASRSQANTEDVSKAYYQNV